MDNNEYNFNDFTFPLQGQRYQSSVGKRTEEVYNEGKNIVKLSLAKVIRVNYKYNTVDLMTIRHKDPYIKNYADNGKFSARLPVTFGGRTPEGKPYGSNTLVTVGSLVLVGFLDGDKNMPIVINIYGEADNQSMLTRTSYTGGDERDKDIQRELWQLFTLYPSMTYKNVDGNGNEEVTFSGKTFMYITDTDEDNEYITDASFGYEQLPSVTFANGEMIEPKSPKAPTVLYVHQGIYDDHRVTFFIKADGTVRMGSRHKDGKGVTFHELKTDGTFSIIHKADTTDPEEDTAHFSRIGIDSDGTIVLQNREHRLELGDTGLNSTGGIGGGGGGSGEIPEDILEELERLGKTIIDMNASIEVNRGRIELKADAELLDEATGKIEYHDTLFTVAFNGINGRVTYEEHSLDMEAVRKYAEELMESVTIEIDDVADLINDLDDYLEGAFKDGIIEESEAKMIGQYLNNLNTEKADIDAKYEELYNNEFLSQTPKNNLRLAIEEYDDVHDNLLAAITGVIADGRVTETEIELINERFEAYNNALSELTKAFEKAVDDISTNKVRDAEGRIGEDFIKLESNFEQLAESITSRVDREEVKTREKFEEVEENVGRIERETENRFRDTDTKIDESKREAIEEAQFYRAEITSTNGTVFKNDRVNTTLFCTVYLGETNLTDSTEANRFNWTRISDNSSSDTQWNQNNRGKKNVILTEDDVPARARFICTVTVGSGDDTREVSSQISIVDVTDIIESPTRPSKPFEGLIWVDTSGNPPYQLKMYKNGKWEKTSYETLEELDPEQYARLLQSYESITSLDDDGKLTRYERGVVQAELIEIVGKRLGATENMPTIAQIDSSEMGEVHKLRKNARDLGISTGGTEYTRLETAYTNLRNINSYNPKPWNTTSTAILNLTKTGNNSWDKLWEDYFFAKNAIEVLINQRSREYAEWKADEARDDAIKRVSQASEYDTAELDNPMIIDAPITTVGLPSFQGRHVDGWEIIGRKNIITDSNPYNFGGYDGSTVNVETGVSFPELGESRAVRVTSSGGTTPLKALVTYGRIGEEGKVHTASVYVKNNLNAYRMIRFNGISDGDSNWTEYNIKPNETLRFVAIGVRNTNNFQFQLRTTSYSQDIDYTVYGIKLEEGSMETPYIHPDDYAYGEIPRIQPVTDPVFSSVGSFSVLGRFYGDGYTNDEFIWDRDGTPLKIKRWEDMDLTGDLDWVYTNKGDNNSRNIRVHHQNTPIEGLDISNRNEVLVNHFGEILPVWTESSTPTGENVRVYSFSSSEDTMSVGIPNSMSGWADGYGCTQAEMKAYFNGWRMCDGTLNGLYSSGTKTWYPIGDNNLNRSVTSVPTEVSPTITEGTIRHYQFIYPLVFSNEVIIDYNGLLELIQGENEVTIDVAEGSPEIQQGSIKYATNLATATADIKNIIPNLQRKISNAEEKITDDAIINTVTSSVEYEFALESKANMEDLEDLATRGELDELGNSVRDDIGNAIDNIDFSPYVTQSEFDQRATDITAKFHATGGVNLIKNSVGFGGLDFWHGVLTDIEVFSNQELNSLGFSSGFYFPPQTRARSLRQAITVNRGYVYTLSCYINKTNSSTDGGFQVQIKENGTTNKTISLSNTQTTDGYEYFSIDYVPQSSEIEIWVYAWTNTDASITGLMFNIGDIPLQWTLATGEIYNTNVRLDMNGIRVSQLNEDLQETGYTQITPDEFAGYYDSSGNGTFEKVFFLNGEETVTKKLRARDEITMGNIKIIEVNSTNYNGWAFVPNVDDE